MKRLTKIATTALSMAMLVGVAAGCSTPAQTSAPATAATQADIEETEAEEDLGFTEVEIFSGVEKEFLNLNAVYFQPVDMTGGYKASDYDCHLELDVSALENGLGYGKGDWVPYLTVEYVVTKNDGDFETSGTFMPMAASDGPHYGANIKMDGDGLYTVKFTVKFPDSSTYLIHTDNTGPDTHEFPKNIEYTCDNWQFTNGAWAE
ncbi:MAG: iron transporter [Eubacteriales bacterium]|nr:iron transporter [Eubacteriales bacterium]